MRLFSLLGRFLRVREKEAGKVALMFVYLLLVVTTIIMGRITRDALFVSVFDEGVLAYMYITVAVLVPIFALMYARIADRFRRDKLISSTLVVCAFALLVGQVLVLTDQSWVYILLYNSVEIIGTFLIIQFWTFAGDLFSSREAKRLFPIIGGGGILASTLCGVGVSALVKGLGVPTQWLLTPQIFALIGCFFIVRALGRREKDRLQESITGLTRVKKTTPLKENVQEVFKSKHLRIIAGMTVVTFITVPLIDYQFKVLTMQHFSEGGVTQTDAFSSFMGVFYSLTGLVAAATQLFFTGRILERFGIAVSLLILPLSLMLGTAGMVLGVAAFSMALLAKGAENAFRYSIYDATMQVIYTPVPGNVRGRAKTFIDGILKPLAGGVAGVTIAVVVERFKLPVTHLSFIALGCVLIWFGLVLRIRKEYVQQLLSSLRRRRLDFSKTFEIEDPKMIDVLTSALASDDDAEIRNSLELAKRVRGRDLSVHVLSLAVHKDPDIRVRVFELLALGDDDTHAPLIKKAFSDDNETVKATALRAYCALKKESGVLALKPFLKTSNALVRGAAVAAMIRHGGTDGVLAGAGYLDAMRIHSDEAFRHQAALIYQEIKARNFYSPVLALMNDSSLRVQNAAITAAGEMKAVELIPALIYKLSRTENARCAAHALARYGEDVTDILTKVLSHAPEEASVRRQVPKILERIGSLKCLDALMENLDLEDPDTRFETARAAGRLRQSLDAQIDPVRVRTVLDTELHEHYQQLAALSDLEGDHDANPELMRDAIRERLERSLDRVFRLLGILYPLRSIDLVYSSLQSRSKNARANAIEVLDNVLESELKRRILPLVEELSAKQRIKRGAEFYTLERRAPAAWLGGLLRSREPWIVSVALHMTSEIGAAEFTEDVIAHLTNSDPVVRETALRTLACIVSPQTFIDIVPEVAENDTDPRVRRFGESFLEKAYLSLKNTEAKPAP